MVKTKGRRKPPPWLREVMQATDAEVTQRVGPRGQKPRPLRYSRLFAEAQAALDALPPVLSDPSDGAAFAEERSLWNTALSRYEIIAERLKDETDRTVRLIQQAEAEIGKGDWGEADVTMGLLDGRLWARLKVPYLRGRGPGHVVWHTEVLELAQANPGAPLQRLWFFIRRGDAPHVTAHSSNHHKDCTDKCVEGPHLHSQADEDAPLHSASQGPCSSTSADTAPADPGKKPSHPRNRLNACPYPSA